MPGNVSIIAGGFLAAQLLLAQPAHAYCVGSTDQLIERSEALFVGIPVQQMSFPIAGNYHEKAARFKVGIPREQLSSSHSAENFYHELTTFHVVETLKGPIPEEIGIWTCHGCSEGLSLNIGEQTLVSASMREDRLHSSYCSLGDLTLSEVKAAIQKAGTSQ